jgi:hypothetical protein
LGEINNNAKDGWMGGRDCTAAGMGIEVWSYKNACALRKEFQHSLRSSMKGRRYHEKLVRNIYPFDRVFLDISNHENRKNEVVDKTEVKYNIRIKSSNVKSTKTSKDNYSMSM